MKRQQSTRKSVQRAQRLRTLGHVKGIWDETSDCKVARMERRRDKLLTRNAKIKARKMEGMAYQERLYVQGESNAIIQG